MTTKKSQEKELRWRDILRRQTGSGLSIRQFCAKERVSEPSFYAWRKKLRGRVSRKASSRTSSRQVDDARNGRAFIPLKLLDASSALEVIHPLGYRVRVSGEVNVTALQHVLDVLDGRRDR